MTSTLTPPPTMMVALTAPPHFEDERKEEGEIIISNNNNNNCSRHALKQELARLSKSLTKHEHGFLERLADHGEEEAVVKARRRLSDASLFFEIHHHHPLVEPDVVSAPAMDHTTTTTTTTNTLPIPATIPLRRTVGSDGDVSSLGRDDRRLEYLENRRKSQLHGQIWKAHESGLPLNRVQLVGGRHHSITSATTSPIVPAKAGILRASISVLSTSPSLAREEEAKIFRPTPAEEQDRIELPAIPPPDFKLGRGFSDGSRKSVTFNDVRQLRLFTRRASVDLPISTRRSSIDLPPSAAAAAAAALSKPARMVRSASLTEGIDLDAMLGSQSAKSSILGDSSSSSMFMNGSASTNKRDKNEKTTSVPPIQHPRHLESFSYTPSLHMAHSVHSEAQTMNSSASNNKKDKNEKTTSFPPIQHPRHLESFPSTPSLHMAHSVHSDAHTVQSIGTTESGIPPLRMAQRVQSDSMSALSWDMSEDSIPCAKEAFRSKYTQGWASPFSKNEELLMKPQVLKPHPQHANGDETWQKPVLLRRTSQTMEEGEGIEVTELEGDESLSSSFRVDSLINARRYSSLLSLADSITMGSIKTASSYEEGPTYGRDNKEDIFRIRKSFSDDEVANIFLGVSRRLLKDNSSMNTEQRPEDDFDDTESWPGSEFSSGGHFDSWNVLKDEYENGYGGGGTLPFRILGTSSDDINSHPHVLSPPLMESLQNFLPWSLSESNFWMKYSMVRDGASMHSMLQHVRGSKYTILAVETMDGEVFGCFTSMPWRKNWNFFGSGESFLWRMRHSRQDKCHSIIDQAHMESEIDVYPWTQEDNCFQLCTHNRIAVGGGSGAEAAVVHGEEDEKAEDDPDAVKAHEWGFGLTLDSDLLTGTTSPCATFGNPSLSTVHSDGSRFEIINLEVWTLTPCATLEDALKLELGQLFLEAHTE